TTLLRAVARTAGLGVGDCRTPGDGALAPTGGPRERGAGAALGGAGVSEVRPPDADSFSIARSSGNVRSGNHSSKPSRQTSESSVTAPPVALRRSSLRRTGPTGTPLMPTYHSSVLELEDRTAIAA